ncbi:MAG: N-6 DNA methylase [Deltaproteobacteria bacterium]|nr:N-6 DNA methylase [Deltaproteobacteria bacterium]
MLHAYLKGIHQTASQGDATEESYYPVLKSLLEAFADSSGHPKAHVTVLPKKTEAGNPDFRVWDGKQHIVGYIEAKAPTQENLEIVETSAQLKRYLHTFPNLILTNFFQFRLYRDGNLIDAVQIARPFTVYKLKAVPQLEKEEEFLELLEKFFAFSLPKTYSAKSLAVELAKRTRFLKEQILSELEREEAEKKPGFTSGFYEAFQKYLIGSLTKDTFVDLYAQTITYGLFAARTRAKNGFNRKLAYDLIPPTIGILRDVFHFISLGELPQQMEWVIDDIAEVLAVTDIDRILKDRKGRDPIVHFYEPFLAEYDPKERERRGVYFTPEPVVSYIVRSLHRLLKDVFGRADGFASTSVRVLDPAAGTCTFPAEATRQAADEFIAKYGEGGKAKLIPDHILKNFYAFELMMAPYAVGHLKIGYLLEELGHLLQKDERFQLYLTNTLDMQELQETKLPGMSSLAEESHLAGIVKKETPILVILGNPPYSGHSANIGEWISQVIRDYYKVDGQPLGEKNPKWLQDDYVKFIRFAQWKIEQAGEGVLGFITNHSYLDNPTFRGMRQSLMNTFEQICLLDLHGNSLKKERCPDRSKDENVFDIRQGVAIAIFVKKAGLQRKIHHAEVWGLREKKYDWLERSDISTTTWTKIYPKSPLYLFVPRDEVLLERYMQFPKVTEIFPVNCLGVQTHRDEFAIDMNRETLKRRIRMVRDKNLPDDVIRQTFSLKDNRDWKMSEKRKAIIADDDWEKKITEILYRPFDTRWIFYHKDAIDFGRPEVMRHMLQENLALNTMRQTKMSEWRHAVVSDRMAPAVYVEIKDGSNLFPLHLYPDAVKKDLLSQVDDLIKKKPNLSPTLLQSLKEAYQRETGPEDIFYYIYAVLYAPTYRTKYVEFLKTDFPRIPFTKDGKLFKKLAAFGKELVDLHLLRSPNLDKPICRFQGKGDNRVEKQAYNPKDKRVYINKAQYFEGVEPEVWQYQIGGYQVLDKWLKDRRKRILSLEDIKHYCRVVTALPKTMEIQAEIDELYSGVEESVMTFP